MTADVQRELAAGTAPHTFRPDHPAEPGYRSHCLDCGRERHPAVPQPRNGDEPTEPGMRKR